MNLHEQYQALIARGMPEHPRLSWFFYTDKEPVKYDSRTGEPIKFKTTEWGHHWRLNDPQHEEAEIDEADARDLIERHALRWFYEAVDAEAIIERYNGPTRPTGNTKPGFSLEYCRAGDDSTGYSGFGETLIEAIIEATKHLETKG